jgi:hypothetical protein
MSDVSIYLALIASGMWNVLMGSIWHNKKGSIWHNKKRSRNNYDQHFRVYSEYYSHELKLQYDNQHQ